MLLYFDLPFRAEINSRFFIFDPEISLTRFLLSFLVYLDVVWYYSTYLRRLWHHFDSKRQFLWQTIKKILIHVGAMLCFSCRSLLSTRRCSADGRVKILTATSTMPKTRCDKVGRMAEREWRWKKSGVKVWRSRAEKKVFIIAKLAIRQTI